MFCQVFGAQCFTIVGHLMNLPVIGVSTTTLYPWLHRLVAQPYNLAFISNICVSEVPNSMNFWHRLYNSVSTLINNLHFDYLTTRYQDEIIRRHFGPDMPSVRELETKISLVLTNTHIALNTIQPKTPAAIDVGGLHVVDEDSTLPPVRFFK